ncbi:hypothetical protein G7083_07370 [Vibrio sp. HDW18]|nr:hypothetical protein G7083_07370 [Vibrio sp. HDW18]
MCDTYNHRQILGLSNWQLPTQEELLNNLFTQHGNMFTSREWPTSTRYWSSTTDGDYISNIDLSLGYSNLNLQDSQYYASCISKP